jgi:hypothetical protein
MKLVKVKIYRVVLIIVFQMAFVGNGITQIATRTVYSGHVECSSFNPNRKETIFAGNRNRLLVTYDAGQTWDTIFQFARDVLVRHIIIPKSDTCVLLVTTSIKTGKPNFFRSVSCGHSFDCVDVQVGLGDAVCEQKGVLYCTRLDSLAILYSIDEGLDWKPMTPVSPMADSMDETCSLLACDFKQLSFLVGTNKGKIWRFSGQTGWKKSLIEHICGLSEVPGFAQLGGDTMLAVTTTGEPGCNHQGLLLSSDSGESWKAFKSPENLWCAAVRHSGTNRICISQFYSLDKVFTQSSILTTERLGDVWTPLIALQDSFVWTLSYSSDDSWLAIAGDGGLHIVRF